MSLRFKNERSFQIAKTKGVGSPTISKFLGGNWNTGKIQGALEVLDDESSKYKTWEELPHCYKNFCNSKRKQDKNF